MSSSFKIMTIVGTRPEIIRLSAVIRKLDRCKVISHILVHTGQNYDYELNEIFFKDFQLRKPDYFLDAAGKTAMDTISTILLKIDPVLEKEKPDAVLILGDTNSCLCAIAAKRRHIPIFHMEAGNRCFDERVPEETNRKIVDHISDINLPYSKIAREYLLHEGIPADRIIKTGSPMYEVIQAHKQKMMESNILEYLELEPQKYFVVSAHREENIEDSKHFTALTDTLNDIAVKYQYPVIVSTHPRTAKKLYEMSITLNPLIRTVKPFGFGDYLQLQLNAKAVLSDSGTISEEASILGFKAVNIRECHERPEAMEEGAVLMSGLSAERVLQCLELLEGQEEKSVSIAQDYFVSNVSDKVLKIILSYTDYINRNMWKQ